MRAAGKGLAHFHCKRHVEHLARHGSLWHPTYPAADLKPYLKTAAAWIKANQNDPVVALAVHGIGLTFWMAGRSEIATRLRGMPPKRRAMIAIARVREAGIEPERILAIALATAALIEEDPGSHRSREFRIVQTAKAVHRLASGYHRTWDFPLRDGTTAPYTIHAYPRSTGRVLRHIGEAIEKDSAA
ncbi:hypothetical protein C2U72_13320, partial [Prosthecomicrobium hirschii]|uniref:hypothetical protein n=1 Tax=Prosthecodimorpha hirschii TaxID=665126 RepID=UPI001125D44C